MVYLILTALINYSIYLYVLVVKCMHLYEVAAETVCLIRNRHFGRSKCLLQIVMHYCIIIMKEEHVTDFVLYLQLKTCKTAVESLMLCLALLQF